MPLQTNLNIKPYHDDFDPLNNYYRVLYKAGYPVQARELTQSQSILQDQIEKLGSRIMKEGDNVVPGEFSMNLPVSYVRASSITQGSTVDEYVGYTLKGVVSGVIAKVVFATSATDDDDATFYVNYQSSGNTSEYKTFLEGETLESNTDNLYTATVGISTISKPIGTAPMGQGSLFTVKPGSYFVDGFIVRNDEQTITLDKYTTQPTYKVGFIVSEDFITSNEDPSLLDNSQGSSNFAAPGADRLKITLTLVKRDIESIDANFIQLAEIFNGNLLGNPSRTVKWDWLHDIMAQRTFDESGDYIVTEFPIQTYEYWNNEKVDGVFDPDPDTLTYPPVPGSQSETRLSFTEADSKYALRVNPGLAYVQGYRVGYTQPFYLYGNKARSLNFRDNTVTPITEGFNITVTNCNSAPDFQNITGELRSVAFNDLILYHNFIDGFVGESVQPDGRPKNAGNAPWTTYHIITNRPIEQPIPQDIVEIDPTNNGAVLYSPNRAIERGDVIGGATVLVSTKITPTPSGVMRPRYYTPNQMVDDNNGFFGFNSTYKLGIMTSLFFTELAIAELPSSDWSVGELVFGEQSGAFANIEEGSTKEILIISNSVGEFIAGETVVQGNNVGRIYRNNEVAGFNFPDDTVVDLSGEDEVIVSAIGSTLKLTVADGDIVSSSTEIKVTQQGRDKLLNFPYPEGSSFSNRINYVLETKNGCKGYAVIVPAKISNTLNKTKSLFSQLELNTTDKFSADISVQNNSDCEIINIADNSLYTGRPGNNFLTCDNFSGDASEQLVAGDLVTFVDDTGRSINRLIHFTTKPIGYGSLRSKSVLYFTTAIPNSVTGKTVQRVRVKSSGSPDQTLIFQLPQKTVSTLETDPLTTRINYIVHRQFYVNALAGSTQISITTTKDNEVFTGLDNNTNIFIVNNTNMFIEGRSLTIENIEYEDGGRKIEYTLSEPIGADVTLKILTPVFVTNAKSKRKLYRDGNDPVAPVDPIVITYDETDPEDFDKSPASQSVISLGIADVHRINSIKMGEGNAKIDVTDNYTFDNGQRDNVYDISRLILKPGKPKAIGQIEINCAYFEHSDEGDFFSVDSYTNELGVNYNAVPVYSPQNIISNTNQYDDSVVIQLRDCVDFRPIVNTTGNLKSVISLVEKGVDAQGATNFRDTTNQGNGFAPRIPVSGTQFMCDMSYYLPRYDSLFLESTGALTLIEGKSDSNPIPPADLATGIRLYNIYVPAYTFSVKHITNKKFNYKRYRMKDIAGIERRIDRVEELVTLSILEQSALNMSVRDAVTGLDRFKNGIVVDTFRDHSKGEVGSSQYRNSVDPKNSHLRSPHFTDQAYLEEINQTKEQRSGNGYRSNNGIVTLDYENVRILQNPFATRYINLQPFTVFTYDGNLELTPSIDTWQDVTRLPDLVIEDNSLFDAMVNLTGEMADNGFGTVWGDWETTAITGTSNETVIQNTENNANAVENAINNLAIQGVGVDFAPSSDMNVMQNILAQGGRPPLVVFNNTTSTTQQRTESQSTINVSTGRIENTSYGDRVVDVQLARTMRTVPVLIQAYRLKPNTRYYAFFDDVDVTDWVSVDNTEFVQGRGNVYVGVPNTDPKGFGEPLMSDDVGTLTGVFLIPNGRPPVKGSTFNGDLQSVQYQMSGSTRSFNTGQRKLRITSSVENKKDLSQVEGYAEADFVASGVLMDKQETIVSTRIPSFNTTTQVTGSETRVQETQETVANYFDPVAQSFLIDENSPEGVFVTELDVFFRTKDATEAVEAFIVTTDGQVPTENILPHSKCVMESDTTLRVVGELVTNGDSITAGTTVVGQVSGATGVVKTTSVFESPTSNPTRNSTNTIYNVVLSNYFGEFIAGEEIVPDVNPRLQSSFTVAADEIVVTRVDLVDLGKNYTTAEVTFSEPELPGGQTATATALIKNGMVYQIDLTSPGSGYTKSPSVRIEGDGSDAEATLRFKDGRKGVRMGVCTSEDGTASTTFKFKAPVFLMGNTYYAFVVKSPNSLDYTIWISKLGEDLLGTETRVTEQPSLGSLFKSQNGGLWTEDQTEDIKFVMRRAEFFANTTALIKMNNSPLPMKEMPLDPIETNSAAGTGSDVFGDNPQVIKIYHPAHGHAPDDLVKIQGVDGQTGGVPLEEINTLHTVINSDLTHFTIKVDTPATASVRGGGTRALSSFNRPYEVINIYSGLMAFGTSQLSVQNRATEHAGVTLYNQPYQYRLDEMRNLNMMESYYYNGAKQIASRVNECKYRDSLHLQGRKSLETTIEMMTGSAKVSPVIDLDRTNATITRNLIDNPSPTDEIFGVSSTTVTLNDTFGDNVFSKGQLVEFKTEGEDRKVFIDSFNTTTKKIKLKGKFAKLINDGTLYNSSQLSSMDIRDTVNQDTAELFVPETRSNGSVYSKWISRLFLFENQCDGVEIKLATIFYDINSIKLYYKPKTVGFDFEVSNVPWVPFNETGLPNDVDKIKPRSVDSVNPNVINSGEWKQLTWSVQDLAQFDGIQIKIVMTSDNPAQAPLIDDLQLVASE